ncbi:lantibiotic dehydratase [Geothrix limicola]|uniref:lantibiotic dehydratase n=1 Tax=Geothrix limicola TaxID=2927978 RepID=UPI0025578F3E|nr:lantibiotic dehydratase [Geothrix limicola]
MREAVALASPDLASRLEAWQDGSMEPTAARRLEWALLKYLSRMSHRATPFGLFAGVSLGSWTSTSRLSVPAWREGRKVMRLDWGVLESAVDRLEQEADVRNLLTYRPNSSLYARGGWYRYLERRPSGKGQERSYHLEAVEATAHLDVVLQQAREGARLVDLTSSLAHRMAVDPAEARSFLEQVIEARFLCGNLHPPLTCPDPMGWVTALLRSDPTAGHRAEALEAVARDLETAREAPIGTQPQGYGGLAASLAGLGISPETKDVLQVDLFRPVTDLTLSPLVQRALEDGAETLRRLTPPPAEGPLDRFRVAFLDRYGARWMPLLEVLDEESGLGFDGGLPLDSPLLEGLAFPSASRPRLLSRRDQFLLKQIHRWHDTRIWELSDADVEALENPDPPRFPPSFAALTSLAADSPETLDRGTFQFWMEQYSGPTAARWLGRFASGDPGLEQVLKDHLRKEEAACPEALFAEVVHVPEGRMGNVLARPALRVYEIPFLATPGVSDEKTILPSDLRVTVRGGRVVLASARLGREVVPRLSSAHNFAHGPVVYRFLARLQDQDGRPGGWSWGALSEQPFLPRVSCGRHVLSKARWRIEAAELKSALDDSREGAWGAFQALRERRGLPRFVVLNDADNGLLVDLDRVLWVEALHHLVSGRPFFLLTECFPDPGQALVTSPEGALAHELVIPFEAASPDRPGLGPLPEAQQDSGARAYPPGSEWLYLKLYCGAASADRLLVELEPFLRATQAQGLWDRWHFIRYRDPEHHLRLRFHGVPGRLLAELLPLVHGHLKEPLAQGLLWKWQVDTFEPELERYGGPHGFALAEAWFFEDSGRVLEHLVAGPTMEARWRSGFVGVDAIWAALGLDLRERKDLAQASREAFRKEFGDTGETVVQIGAKFRNLRKDLERAFQDAAEGATASGSLARIREAIEQGLIQEDRISLASSLAHMHLNRLFRDNPREQEWVLMEFLARMYESRMARQPAPC